ncbi:MAG: hypothetical protein BWY98_01320 [Tenericutes bacterium ADurb.BinA155]|nr:MAG: hypothetical protein BWY98_01320 [Tenericutes bacterium ADurb.BinA155]
MNKKALFLVSILPLFLTACGTDSVSSGSSAAVSSSSIKNPNTLTSVLSSFGTNLTTSASFPFLSDSAKTTPVILSTYVEKGCYFHYSNFASMTDFGLVNVAADAKAGVAAGVYKYTQTSNVLTLGDNVSTTSADFRTLYANPNDFGAEVAAFAAAFVPEIKDATTGYFDLNKDGKSADLLKKFAEYLGVYNVLTSVPDLSLNYATFYFAATGTAFTAKFYCKYQNGYDLVDSTVAISQVGKTVNKAIDNYFAAASTSSVASTSEPSSSPSTSA